MDKARSHLMDFFSTLSTYDYIGFFLSFFIFILFIILALLLRAHIKRSLFLVTLGFISLFIGPLFAHSVIKKSIFNSDANITQVKQLYYSDTLLIKGVMNYKGTKDANHCKVEAKLHKKGTNMIKSFVYGLKAFRSGHHNLDKTFTQGDSSPFKIVIEPFNYQGDYNITINSGCHS
jgi:hypothetical protein